MKAFKGYDEVKVNNGATAKLPEGIYKIKILGIKYQDNSSKGYSDQLIIQYDIAEGEYENFFTNQYKSNTAEDKKYKGVYRLYVPVDDGSEKDGWTKSKFKALTQSVEESNSGYTWNWDEQTLVGKVVGAIFNLKEYSFEGREGFFTNLYRIIPVSEMATAKVPEPTYLTDKGNTSGSGSDFLGGNGGLDEIPFN